MYRILVSYPYHSSFIKYSKIGCPENCHALGLFILQKELISSFNLKWIIFYFPRIPHAIQSAIPKGVTRNNICRKVQNRWITVQTTVQYFQYLWKVSVSLQCLIMLWWLFRRKTPERQLSHWTQPVQLHEREVQLNKPDFPL